MDFDLCKCFADGMLTFLLFLSQLERAADGFSVVAEYYGRGVFNKVGSVMDLLSSQAQVRNEKWTTFRKSSSKNEFSATYRNGCLTFTRGTGWFIVWANGERREIPNEIWRAPFIRISYS